MSDDLLVAPPSARLKVRVLVDHGPDAVDILAAFDDIPEPLPLAQRQDAERLQAALVLAARGNRSEFVSCLRLAQVDWRDALVAAGLENSDWAQRLNAALGPPEN
jgi:hypothetical protein